MRAARKKRRSFSQMMEEQSGRLLASSIPQEWVVHEYAPDYGIDGTVEIFRFIDAEQKYAETLGETVLFQLKSTKSCTITSIEAPWRINVEKWGYRPTENSVATSVIRYDFEDTDELATIEAMGTGNVVVLFLACLDTGRVFFLNLTDYIDKVLSAEAPSWREQGSNVIHIPTLNELKPHAPILTVLRFYALRPKLLALFTTIDFQAAELSNGRDELSLDDWHSMALNFARRLLRFDVWNYEGWALLRHYHKELQRMEMALTQERQSTAGQARCIDFWWQLATLGRTFEDVTREWGLPTALGHAGSYS